MLQAAQRLQSLDAELARQTFLEALLATIYAGRLAYGQDAKQVARAARSATLPPSGSQPPHSQLLIHGLAVRLADGYLAAASTLKQALCRYRTQPLELGWLSVAYNIVAMDLWDDEAWFELAALASLPGWRARTAPSAGFRSRWTISPRSTSRPSELVEGRGLADGA